MPNSTFHFEDGMGGTQKEVVARIRDQYVYFARSAPLDDYIRSLPDFADWTLTRSKPVPTWRVKAQRRWRSSYNAKGRENYKRITGREW